MKKPITPTPRMIRLAKRWRRQWAEIDRLNEQDDVPSTTWSVLLWKHDQTSHDLAEVAAAALVLYGWVPLATSTKRARRKR